METHPRSASASAELTRILLRHAAQLGIDAETLCNAVGLDTAALEDPEVRVPATLFGAIWERIAIETGDQDFGLHFGEAADGLPSGHLLSAVMLNCPTVGEAIERFIRYHGLMADVVQPAMDQRDGQVHLTWTTREPGLVLQRHYSEAILAMFVAVLRRLSEEGIELVRVGFQHPRPDSVSEHRRIFAAPLLFDRERDELVLRREDMERPIFLANPELLASLERLAERLLQGISPPDTATERVVGLLGMMLVKGSRPSLDAVARELAVSPRSLQKSLKGEGASYQGLLDRVRREIAVDAMANPELSLCDVAFLLGFSEQSAFNHAFKRWTGCSPRGYREARGG